MSVTVLDQWPIEWTCETPAVDAKAELAHRVAEDWLRSASGGEYGTGTATEDLKPRTGAGCSPGGAGSCCAITLRHLPVRNIVSVTIDGAILAATSYHLWRGKLVRSDGGCWPSSAECYEPRMTVEYRFGRDVPEAGQVALGELACEVRKLLDGKPCRIPKNARTVSRQGVTIDKGDLATAAMVEAFPLSRAFLDMVNPKRLPGRSRIIDPLNGPARRRVSAFPYPRSW